MTHELLPLVLAAFAAALLSGMGVGSAGLFILYLTLVAGYPQPQAQALNLLFFILSAGSAMLCHARTRRIPPKLVALLILCALPGSVLGNHLVNILDAALIRKLFGGMLIVTGLPSLLRGKREKREQQD
jgi:uncharacterized membrane protein YfcA